MNRRIMGLLLLPVFVLCAIKFRVGQGAAQEPAGAAFQKAADRKSGKFLASLPAGFRLPEREDHVGWRLLADYGGVLVARGGVTPPVVVMFPDEALVARWQATLVTRQVRIGGIPVELQAPAMEALLAARQEAIRQGLKITPHGRDAARRTYADTVKLWLSRVVASFD